MTHTCAHCANPALAAYNPGPTSPLMSNTPKLNRIVLKQRRFESARGSKTSNSPEVRLAELDLPEVRSRMNAQGGEKF